MSPLHDTSEPITTAYVPLDGAEPAGVRILTSRLVPSDAQPAFQINGDGSHNWGPGGASATDTLFYRETTNVLRTDTHLVAGMQVQSFRGASGMVALSTIGGGPTNPPAIYLGGSFDTSLYRQAAGVVKTDGALCVVGNLWFGSVQSGAVGTNQLTRLPIYNSSG